MTLIKLFNSEEKFFKTVKIEVYGNKESVVYYTINLFLRQKLYFVLIRYQGKEYILVNTEVEQDPEVIIGLYNYYFKIEWTFREMKQVTGGFSYQFWSKSMPKLKRYSPKGAPYLRRCN